MEKGKEEYTIIPLLGRFKGEHQESQHLIPCVNETKSGIKIRDTLRRLIKDKRLLGFADGPAISDSKGKLLTSRDLDDMLIESLVQINSQDPSLFPGDFSSEEDITTSYQCFRTFRRSAATRAVELKIAKTKIGNCQQVAFCRNGIWKETPFTNAYPLCSGRRTLRSLSSFYQCHVKQVVKYHFKNDRILTFASWANILINNRRLFSVDSETLLIHKVHGKGSTMGENRFFSGIKRTQIS